MLGILSQFETRSLTEPKLIHLAGLVGQLTPGPCLLHFAPGHVLHSQLLISQYKIGDLNSGPQAGTADTSPPEPSPSPDACVLTFKDTPAGNTGLLFPSNAQLLIK